MKKNKKILLLILSIVLIAAAFVFYKMKEKPATSNDSEAIAEFTANNFILGLDTSQLRLSKVYMDKNIAITGIIKEMNEKTYNLIIDAGSDAYINCSFDSTQFTQCKSAFSIGKETNIKGIYYGCDGFEKSDDLMDLMPTEKTALLKTCCINKK
jgi:uncharacterized protein YpmB